MPSPRSETNAPDQGSVSLFACCLAPDDGQPVVVHRRNSETPTLRPLEPLSNPARNVPRQLVALYVPVESRFGSSSNDYGEALGGTSR